MIRAGVGQSSQASTQQAVEEALDLALAQAGSAQADAAVIFFSVEHAARERELAGWAQRRAGTECIAGCSTSGVLSSGGEVEGGHGLAALVLSSDRMECRPFLFKPFQEQIGRAHV